MQKHIAIMIGELFLEAFGLGVECEECSTTEAALVRIFTAESI